MSVLILAASVRTGLWACIGAGGYISIGPHLLVSGARLERRGTQLVSGRAWVEEVERGLLYLPRTSACRQLRGIRISAGKKWMDSAVFRNGKLNPFSRRDSIPSRSEILVLV